MVIPRSRQILPCVVWLTGLSGAGKSTIAQAVLDALRQHGVACYGLDGDVLRQGLNKDLGFNEADRLENNRRTAHVATLMAQAGLVCVVAVISPLAAHRTLARQCVQATPALGPRRFIEVFVNTPLELAEQRDPKGLYARARLGLLPHFTGIDAPYETPVQPELDLRTAELSVQQSCERILAALPHLL